MTKDEAVTAYDQLVQFRQQNQLQKTSENPGKVETHHILPISCGGEDVPENRINLLAKEHFMAHVYLWIIHHEDEFHYSTMCALNMMVKGTLDGSRKELRDFILLSEEYQKAREEYAQFTSETIGKKISGEKNGSYGKHWYYDPITLETGKYNDEQKPFGWIKGRVFKNKDDLSFIKGRVWICRNDGTEQRLIDPTIAQQLVLNQEWRYGHLPNTKKIVSNESKQKHLADLKKKHLDEAKQLQEIGKFDCQISFPYNGVVNRKQVRRYLLVTGHHCCAKCEKSGIQLIVHAKDGNCRNLQLDNYEFLCRECYLASGTAGFSGRHRKKKT